MNSWKDFYNSVLYNNNKLQSPAEWTEQFEGGSTWTVVGVGGCKWSVVDPILILKAIKILTGNIDDLLYRHILKTTCM